MKKLIVSFGLIIASVCSFAQVQVFNGQVLINGSIVQPASLTVGGGTYTYPSDYTMGTYSNAQQNGSNWTFGVLSEANSSTVSSNGRSFGVLSVAGNATSGYNYGVTGIINGSNNGTGIYGSVGTYYTSIPGKYAGYFHGSTYVNGTLTATNVVTPSDIRLKTDIEKLSDYGSALENVLNMNVVTYNYKEQELSEAEKDTASVATIEALEKFNQANKERHYGLLAQELQEIYPDLVKEGQDGYLGINYIELVPVLIRSIQELKTELDDLKRNNAIQSATEQSYGQSKNVGIRIVDLQGRTIKIR